MKRKKTLESDAMNHIYKCAIRHTMTNRSSMRQQLQQQQQYSNTAAAAAALCMHKYIPWYQKRINIVQYLYNVRS